MIHQKINRRKFLFNSTKGITGILAANALAGPYIKNTKFAKKVIVLGIDGMDPILLNRFIEMGELPTFKKFLNNYSYCQLKTTLPPQSPVAWSSFITGSKPGKHGIFDFIHRDPDSFTPYLSTSRSYDADRKIKIGDWSIPLESGKIELLRYGQPLWDILEKNDIPAVLNKIPASFPVGKSDATILSGMGTPDILGTYGTFTLFTDSFIRIPGNLTGGRVVKIQPQNHTIACSLEGPPNSLKADPENTKIDFMIYRDPRKPLIKVDIQGHQLVLKQGEWSEWIPVKFEFLPNFVSISGMVRLYVQQVHPKFRLYVSPINIDPRDSHLPIANPDRYSKDLSNAIGRFYTQGFPEDTKALSAGIFSNEEFIQQAKIVLEERKKAFEHEFDQFKEGFFFFYFSTIDQNTHMLWRLMDPAHPLYEPKETKKIKNTVLSLYKEMDKVLYKTLSKVDSQTSVILLSDHGFAPFYREFHLSTWLVQNGYTHITDMNRMHQSTFYDFVDWEKTKAFALGLNGIYINIKGREKMGAVQPPNSSALKKELIKKLLAIRDPKSGKKIVTAAYDSQEIYQGPYTHLAPDIIIGYNKEYRISDGSVLGKFPKGIINDRHDKWAADHCMDPSLVPGVLLCNEELKTRDIGLWDLAPSILQKFGISKNDNMDGESVFI